MSLGYNYILQTVPTVGGTTVVNHGLGVAPAVIIGALSMNGGTSAAHANLGLGFWTSGAQWSISQCFQNGTTSPLAGHAQKSGDFFYLLSPTNSTATTLVEASITTVNGTQYSINFSTVPGSSSNKYWMIALAGDVSGAEIVNCLCPASTGNQSYSTTLGQPSLILFFGAGFASNSGASTGIGTNTNNSIFVGWATSSSAQAVDQFGGADYQLTNKCVAFGTSAGLTYAASLSSIGASSFTLNWSSVLSGQYVFALCLYGTLQASVFSNNSPTSNGNQADSLSFSPILSFLQTQAVAASSSSLSNNSWGLGLYDGTNSVWIGENDVGTGGGKSNSIANSIINTSDCLVGYNSTPSVSLAASGVDLSSEVKLDFTTTSAGACQYLGLALGSSTLAPPGTPTGLTASYASATSVKLTWTPGSGTVTDNKVKYGTDGSTFGTTVDQGSAVTTATITGLTNGQLYFFEVDAENGSGASAYTAPVPWVCGSNVDAQVSGSANDAYENGSGTVTIADSTDSLSTSINQMLGFRFASVALANPPVVQANLYLYFTTGGTGTVGVICEKSTSSAAFAASTHNLSNRTQTSTSATWTVGGTSSGWNASPDISHLITEVINQPGWASGDAITVFVSYTPVLCAMTCEMYDGNPVQAAILAIFTGASPVSTGLQIGTPAAVSGLVAARPIVIGTAVAGASAW